jgi:hypothetical protein
LVATSSPVMCDNITAGNPATPAEG